MSEKPWMEEWRLADSYTNSESVVSVNMSEEWPEEWPEEWGDMQDARAPMRAKLAAAAPAMARALCLVEWAHRGGCSACGGYGPSFPQSKYVVGHEPSCPLDAALTAAGLSPEDREAVRRVGK